MKSHKIFRLPNVWVPIMGLLCFLVSTPGAAKDAAFKDYWYQGKAEITSYTLEQARYGEVRQGHAVLIYVTEDFSRSKQVKLDNPYAAGADSVGVMKLNLTKKFNTGIYPYSMMTSVFTPVEAKEHASTLKITTSVQEWCGHIFTQLNRQDSGYRVQQLSYFESEGDEDFLLEEAIPEDELWVTLRLDPQNLPVGDLRIIPGTMHLRLRHRPWDIQPATATLEDAPDDKNLKVYTVEYPNLGRTLTFRFKADFPHELEEWEETELSRGGRLTTRGKRLRLIQLDYWNKNRTVDEKLRRDLGLN